MKILIVDNGTSYLSRLRELLREHTTQVVAHTAIDVETVSEFDTIILSGGHDFPISGNEVLLRREIELIRGTKKPMLGICFGFELIADVCGAQLELLDVRERGTVDIKVLDRHSILPDVDSFQVWESHRWVIKDVGDELVTLAVSRDGIEAFRHKTLPLYGVQFHLEMMTDEVFSSTILDKFLSTSL